LKVLILARQSHIVAHGSFYAVIVGASPEDCLVIVRPVTIRNAFELTVIDGIFLEDVAKCTFESLPNTRLVVVCLVVIGPMLTCSDFRFVVRT
jgi:hypothetical protein